MKARNLFLLLAATPALAFAQADTAKAAPKPVPFDWADWTWLNGNARTKDSPLDSQVLHRRVPPRCGVYLRLQQPEGPHAGRDRASRGARRRCRCSSSASAATSTCDHVRGRLMTQFGMYSTHDAAQRREPVARPVESRQRLPLHLRGVRRLPLRPWQRHQRRRRHLHVVRRPVQLLQLRQLGVSAVVRIIEHALVLQRRAHPDLPDAEAQAGVLDRQRLAVVRHVQLDARASGMQVLYRPTRESLDALERLLGLRHAGQLGAHAHAQRQQRRGEVLRGFHQDARARRRSRVTVDAGCENGGGVTCSSGTTASAGTVLPRLHGLQPPLVQQGQVRRSRSAAAPSTIRAATSC